MNFVKKNKKPIMIALVQWFLTTLLQVDRLYFCYDHETIYLTVSKFLYLCLLLAAWCFGFHAYRKIKERDVNYCRGFTIFRAYGTIVMMLLLLLWPGTWAWDDLGTLNAISTYESWNPWQNIISGIYQDVLLQILPFPGGIILLQNIIISLCVAFVVVKLEKIFAINAENEKKKAFGLFVRILPFLLPPVLMYQFSGYRMGLYVYLELVMLVILIGAATDNREWHLPYLLLFCFLCVIISVWRSESFFYIPAACILLFVNRNRQKILPGRKALLCILLLITCFLGMNRLQTKENGNNNYEVVSLLRPCVKLVATADREEDKELLADIDRVASVEVMYDNPSKNGTELYWEGKLVRESYTGEDYQSFLKAFLKLSLKYPEVVIAERWQLFLDGSGITGKTYTNVADSSLLFEPENENVAADIVFQKGWIATSPVFKNTRRRVIKLLGMTFHDGAVLEALRRVVWNAVIPLLILLCAWLRLLVKKKWYLFGICSVVLLRVPVVILTQPTYWFMYMLSFYMLGYVYLVYRILIIRSNQYRAP